MARAAAQAQAQAPAVAEVAPHWQEPPIALPARISYRGVQAGTASGYARSDNGNVKVSAACAEAWAAYEKARPEGPAYLPEVSAFVFAFEQSEAIARRAAQAGVASSAAEEARREAFVSASEIVKNRIAAPLALAIGPGRHRDFATICDTIAQAVLVERQIASAATAKQAIAASVADPLAGLPDEVRAALTELTIAVGIVVEERDTSAKDAARYREVKSLFRD